MRVFSDSKSHDTIVLFMRGNMGVKEAGFMLRRSGHMFFKGMPLIYRGRTTFRRGMMYHLKRQGTTLKRHDLGGR
jgi:hypothetical protein